MMISRAAPDPDQPVVLPRSEHSISRKRIDENTLKVLYRLKRQGHKAYLVGGSVRDLLLNRIPKDFDVGTDATPNQVKKIFRNCFLVGRRFRLAHIRFGGNQVVEVATFRRKAVSEDLPEDSAEHHLVVENVFGTPAEDAFRRDFTINALFYDVASFSVLDFVGGLDDLENRRIRAIGDPLVRFVEDPVRMLRALEFAARLDFSLDEEVREAIYRRAPLIAEAAPARLREEVMELFRHRVGGKVLRSARNIGLIGHLLAGYEGDDETFDLLERVDARTSQGREVNESFVLAALYLSRFRRTCPCTGETSVSDAIRIAGLVISPHVSYFRISHGIRHQARELLIGFFRLSRGLGFRGEKRFLRHPLTPLSLELFTLWTEVSGEGKDLPLSWKKALEGLEDGGERPAAKRRDSRPRRRNAGRGKKSPS